MRPGAMVVVLEARDRVGGRTLNEPIGDGKVGSGEDTARAVDAELA